MAKTRAALALVPITLAALAYCQDRNDWSRLNASVSGTLYKSTPLASACFPNYEGDSKGVDESGCAAVQENYLDPEFRTDRFSGYMYSQSELCLSDETDQCLLNTADPSDPNAVTEPCQQGTVPDYYLSVTCAEHVSEAIKFASNHNIPLSIKNSGHDFHARSSGKGTLNIWTHNLKSKLHEPNFVAEGCPSPETHDAITIGAGVQFGELYDFAEEQERTFVGGYSPTVGPSGGWLLGGGHSVLSPVLGLGVDRVLQIKIVTPDGKLRVANSCQNQDLFWALKGGGVAAFGVVIESTSRVEPLIPITVASISVPRTDENVREWLRLMVDEALPWAKDGWGGHVYPDHIVHMNPLLNQPAGEASMRNAIDLAHKLNGTAVVETLPSWGKVREGHVEAQRVGGIRFPNSVLTPEAVFETPEGRANVLKYLYRILDDGFNPYIPVTTPYLYDAGEDDTSITPTWRKAIWSISGTARIDGKDLASWNSTYEERLDTLIGLSRRTRFAQELIAAAVPEEHSHTVGGSYGSEANPFMSDWQKSWYGEEKYSKLLKLKEKYDPENLFQCWKCVGFDEERDLLKPQFKCMGKLQKAIDKALEGN